MVTKCDSAFSFDSELGQQFIEENPYLVRIAFSLATNQTYIQLFDQIIELVNEAINLNRNTQEEIRSILTNNYKDDSRITRERLNLPCWYPYFKDSNGMSPGLNKEALKIKRISVDPLMDEGRRWNYLEHRLLKAAVCSSFKDEQIRMINLKKEIVINKLLAVGVETTNKQKYKLVNEVERYNKQIAKICAKSIDTFLREYSDFSNVDWARISASDFKGLRSIAQLRQKWCNELCHLQNKTKWTDSEDKQLLILRKKFSNWDTISEKIGNFRSPFKCFQRFIYLKKNEREPSKWKPKEDRKLLKLIKLHKVGEEIQWAKIAGYMPGRSRMSCEYRYTRTLTTKLNRGRWTDSEDLCLVEAVDKYGPRNWTKVSECVEGRSALQCRNRWVHVLDPKRRDQPWTWEEHKRLFYFIRLFGRDKCAKIAKFLPGRNNMDVHMRIKFLIKLHIEKNIEEKPPVIRHFAYNYIHYKNRRKNILDKFDKYSKTKQNDKTVSLSNRLGFGSFVEIPKNGVNPRNKCKLRDEEFNDWNVIGSGRWTRVQQKNPNDQDNEERMKELKNLTDEQREEVLLWLETSDSRLETEHEEKKQIPEDPKLAVKFYEEMFTYERIDELFNLIEELIPPMKKDIIYYEKQQNRCQSIGVKKIGKTKSKEEIKENRRCKSVGVRNLKKVDEKKKTPIKKSKSLKIEKR
ncbi:hypothetical protein Mgra_00007794, partial [Meloidogyne graminicola]